MKNAIRRITALILVLSMALSLCCTGAWASNAEVETVAESSAIADGSPEPEESTDKGAEAEPEELPEGEAEPEELPAVEAEPEAEAETAEEQEPELTPQTVTSGKCGENTTWTFDLDKNTLTISGNGATDDYLSIKDFEADDLSNLPENIHPWEDRISQLVDKIIVEEGVTYLGNGLFAGCVYAKSVTLPNSLTGIGEMAFMLDMSLESVSLPAGVTSIGAGAFTMTGLKSVTLPQALTNLGEEALWMCTNLTSVSVASGNTRYSSKGGVLYNKAKTELIFCPEGLTGAVAVPNGVTKIADNAFAYCENLTAVTLPSTLTTIGEGAFAGCTALESIVLPAGLTSIGAGAFSGTAIKSIKLPAAVNQVATGAFANSEALESITVDSNNANYSAKDGVLYNKKQTVLVTYPVAKSGAFTIPSTVTEIASNAFQGGAITELTVPKSVTKIGANAFDSCFSLTKITFNGGAPSIGENAFSGVSATVSYPSNQSSWKSVVTNQYNGEIKWTAYNPAPTQPELNVVQNTSKGVLLQWNKMSGTKKYRVYYKKSGAKSWSKLKDTTSTSYTHSGAKSGTTYVYTVRCLDSKGKPTGSYNTKGVSILFLSQPKLPSLSNSKDGVKISWSKVSGAAKYRVYRKAEDETKWTSITERTSRSYTDKNVKSGKKYTYTVVCISKDGKKETSSYNTDGKTIEYYPAKTAVSSVALTTNGIVVKWEKTSYAKKYRVYRKVDSDKSWTKVKDTTSTSYTDTNVKEGKKYTYTVRGLSADGKTFTTSYDTTGKSITYTKGITKVDAPTITSVTATSSGIEVKWNKVSGAEKYRIYRRKGGTSGWEDGVALANTTATSYVDKNVTAGTTYYYLVRCITADGKYFTSTWKDNSKSITYSGRVNREPTTVDPVLTSVSNSATGVKLTWKAVEGANKYVVFRRNSTEDDWSALKTLSSSKTSYTDTSVKSANRYYYTLRAKDVDGEYLGSYDATGTKIVYIAQPKLTSVKGSAGAVTISWERVEGAYKYRVWRSANGGSLKVVGDTASNSIEDTAPKAGNKYTYVVRCIASDGMSYTSSYDTKGMSIQL